MARQNGFIVKATFFVPSPKDDFAKQAAAANMMAEITASKTLNPAFLELAEVTDVSAKYGSKADDGVSGE